MLSIILTDTGPKGLTVRRSHMSKRKECLLGSCQLKHPFEEEDEGALPPASDVHPPPLYGYLKEIVE